MQIHSHPTPRPAESETLAGGPAIGVLRSPPAVTDDHQCLRARDTSLCKHRSDSPATVIHLQPQIKLPKDHAVCPNAWYHKVIPEMVLISVVHISSLQKTSKPRGTEYLKLVHTMQVTWPLFAASPPLRLIIWR